MENVLGLYLNKSSGKIRLENRKFFG